MHQTMIIDGRPSGLMAVVAASENSSKALLIEKKEGLGRKLKISGGGRCNMTNRLPYEEIIKNIPGNGRFLYSPFSKFDNESIIEFFESRSIKLKEEDHGRMFLVSNESQDIVDTLVNTIKNNNIKVKEETVVNDIFKNDQSFIIKAQDDELESKTIIIVAGGTNVPQTGSTDDGYRFAKNLGHTITELFPTEVPITSSESFIKDKMPKGLSLKNVELSVLKKSGERRINHQTDMIFTHLGVNGPTVLRCGQFVYEEQKNQKKQNIQLQLDVSPEISLQGLESKIEKILSEEPNKYVKNALRGLMGERYLLFMLEQADTNENTTFHYLSNPQLTHLAEHFKQFIFTVSGTLSIERAFVTGGDVSLKEIWPKTMVSKIQPGLFSCGEVLNIRGYTGGYNITSALVTGHVAGSKVRQFIYT